MSDRCLLLISPGIIKWTDMDFGLPHLVSIGGYVQEHVDIRVEILDLNYEGGDWQHLERTLDELGPYLAIGVSCYTSFDYMRVMALARFLKRLYPDVPLITGGYHVSALPEDVIFDQTPFDAVIPGEGEVPTRRICESLLAGEGIEHVIWPKGVVEELDSLPPYRWELLDRYWPRAHDIGRKFQIYLSRGCPYHCTFCMERSKSGYKWRSYSAERAVDELERLSEFTDLSRWIVNLADPLFGFKRSWRREVLNGILERGLLPRQYWTLTRSDDLHDEDVELLAKARFSIGIGMEAGSPDMLELMQKARRPDKYLDAQRRLARLSRKHGMNWAGNIIIGHPGETRESMRQTRDFVYELFASAKDTCGWVSLDPFRLYPGSHVHEVMEHYEQDHGTTFYHKEWWKSWYDGPFRAEHIDPSDEVSFEDRVNFMYEAYAPIIDEVHQKFRGQGRSIDRVFKRSLAEQKKLISGDMRQRLLDHAERSKESTGKLSVSQRGVDVVEFPIGLHVKDRQTRQREAAVRRLLENGVLRTGALIEALLKVAPEDYLGEEAAEAFLTGRMDVPEREGDPPAWLGVSTCAIAFEAINPGLGDRVVDMLAVNGYVAALFSELVGAQGEVVAVHPGSRWSARKVKKALAERDNVAVTTGKATTTDGLKGIFDAIWIPGALPRLPAGFEDHLRVSGGRLGALVGPRFQPQDLVALSYRDDKWHERRLARVAAPVLAGENGWLIKPKPRAS
ncbi:MAG: radical SAM protein [Persicimonas sp.]